MSWTDSQSLIESLHFLDEIWYHSLRQKMSLSLATTRWVTYDPKPHYFSKTINLKKNAEHNLRDVQL